MPLTYFFQYFLKAIMRGKNSSDIRKNSNLINGPSNQWYTGFMKRNPDIKFSKPSRKVAKYDDGFSPENVKAYFEELGLFKRIFCYCMRIYAYKIQIF